MFHNKRSSCVLQQKLGIGGGGGVVIVESETKWNAPEPCLHLETLTNCTCDHYEGISGRDSKM